MSCGGGFKRRSESGRSSADDSPRLRIISSNRKPMLGENVRFTASPKHTADSNELHTMIPELGSSFIARCHIGNGQQLLVQNDGDDTQVAMSSGDSGQQQSQSTGFTTGRWSRPPELFREKLKLAKIFASPLTPDAMMRHGWANLRSSYFRTTP